MLVLRVEGFEVRIEVETGAVLSTVIVRLIPGRTSRLPATSVTSRVIV